MSTDIASLAARSRKALAELESYNQEQVDQLVKIIAKVVFDNAELFARMAVEESKMGNYEDKLKKKLGKSRILWHSLKGKKSIGILSRDPETGITEIAKPVGVVGAVQPCTNPIVTPMANAMAAIKGRNTIIVTPHPRTANCTRLFVEKVKEAWAHLSPPDDILLCVENPTIESTTELMRSVDVVVATGGPGMVKSAYSSGKPSFGVGPGNVQCILDTGIDLKDAVDKIITGRTFDNGIICSGEQTIIMPAGMRSDVEAELKSRKVFVADAAETEAIKNACFPEGRISKDMVGQSVQTLAKAAGISVPEDCPLLAVSIEGSDRDNVLRKEKMFPVIALLNYSSFDEAVEIANHNLSMEGKGHSVCIHSHNREHIEQLGVSAKVSRVIVNAICSTTSGGSYNNGLTPTSTLGCGSWGNNSISENFYYKHLLNITRIALPLENAHVPSDEELWG